MRKVIRSVFLFPGIGVLSIGSGEDPLGMGFVTVAQEI